MGKQYTHPSTLSLSPQQLLSAQPIYRTVPNSPFQPGDEVKVVKNVDPEVYDLRSFVGTTGTVLYLEYNCGCGQQFPDDPMIGVRLANLEVIEFWKEELEKMQSP